MARVARVLGREDSVHVDAFMDYAQQVAEKPVFGLSKQEVTRRLRTSPSQLYRLLDSSNYRKSVDKMLRLLSVLGLTVEWNIVRRAA